MPLCMSTIIGYTIEFEGALHISVHVHRNCPCKSHTGRKISKMSECVLVNKEKKKVPLSSSDLGFICPSARILSCYKRNVA